MSFALEIRASQLQLLTARSRAATPRTSQAVLMAAVGPPKSQQSRTSQALILAVYGPPAAKQAVSSQTQLMAAYSAGTHNVSSRTTQAAALIAYGTGTPGINRTDAWTFVLDGHRFYVLPLGPEGDWAYDTTTQEWCQLQSQGFPGMNFTHGVMWGLRIIGGDALYTYLYELDPNQGLDEQWREVQHMVTGGIATRARAAIGVANVTLTASVGLDQEDDQNISLAFSDDNGVTWSEEFNLPLTDIGTQQLLWPALGSFSAPGRVFRFTDYSGPIRLDGADAVLTTGTGADVEQDGQK